MAAQLLTTERLPTALVLDANSTDADRVREERRSLLDYLHSVAGGVPHTLVMFEPSIEVIFFDCPGVLRRRLGRDVEPSLLALARYAPKQALEMLLADTPPQVLFMQLDDTDLAELRQHPMVVTLRQFVSRPYGSTQIAAK